LLCVKDNAGHLYCNVGRLDVFCRNRLKRRPLEMPINKHHHAPITIATTPFRADARLTISLVQAVRRGAASPSESHRGAVTGEPLANLEQHGMK